jgi:hypothetical protein
MRNLHHMSNVNNMNGMGNLQSKKHPTGSLGVVGNSSSSGASNKESISINSQTGSKNDVSDVYRRNMFGTQSLSYGGSKTGSGRMIKVDKAVCKNNNLNVQNRSDSK